MDDGSLNAPPVTGVGPSDLVRYEGDLPAIPILFLWPHSRCNCRCVMCDIWKKNDAREEIAIEHLERWLEDWKRLQVQSIVLTGGEALMHSRIWEFCELLKINGFRVSILSTGILLHRHAAPVVRHLDAVYVSLDGPPAVHDRIRRVPRAYDKLARGISAVKEQSSSFPVRARCTVQAWNFAHLRATVKAARTLGVDSLGFSAADVTTEAFNRPGGWTEDRVQEVAVAEIDLRLLEQELALLFDECAEEFASGFLIDSPVSLRRRILEYYEATAGTKRFPVNRCNAPWTSAVIEYDGTVRPCYFHPAYGNLHASGSLSAVVNSPSAKGFRDRLDVASDPICQKCVCTMSIYRCDCEWTRTPPYCDNTCSLVSEFLL